MTERLDIDRASIFDNLDERQVEFAAEVDGDEYQFAVQYDVLEALNGAQIGDADDVLTHGRLGRRAAVGCQGRRQASVFRLLTNQPSPRP